MARLVSANSIAKDGTYLPTGERLKPYAAVKWDGRWFGVWKDDLGPVYSAELPYGALYHRGFKDYVLMDDGSDTVTERVMGGVGEYLG